MYIKHIIPFPKARKIVESYMGTKTYVNIVQKINHSLQDSTSTDEYQKRIEKTDKFKSKRMANISRKPKRMHSTETKQIEPCMKTKVNTNTNTEENPKTTEQTKEKRQRSLVRPPDINKDINENKMKDIAIKKTNQMKRITQTQPTPITTSNLKRSKKWRLKIKLHKQEKHKIQNQKNL